MQAKESKDSFNIFEIQAAYSAQPWYNTIGGFERGFVYMDNLDLTAKMNFNEIFNLNNPLSLYIYVLKNNGGMATKLMGDFQVASNIEAVNSWRIFEFFSEKNFFNDRVSILAGLYDLNSEFDILSPGTLFINSSFGIGAEYAQAGRNGPSIFPVSSLGLRLATMLGEHTKFRFAILDAVPGDPQNLQSNEKMLSRDEGALLTGELSYYLGKSYNDKTERNYETRRKKVGRDYESSRNDKINFGAWYFTSNFEHIDDSTRNSIGNFGIYVGMQKYIFNEVKNYISYFLRLGIANPTFNNYFSALSGGFVVSNPFIDIDDNFGLAFSSVMNSKNLNSLQLDPQNIETAIEFTYLLPIKSWLLIQPNMQYIINPSTNKNLENPLSLSILLQINFGGLFF